MSAAMLYDISQHRSKRGEKFASFFLVCSSIESFVPLNFIDFQVV